jgi:hypothetical protein
MCSAPKNPIIELLTTTLVSFDTRLFDMGIWELPVLRTSVASVAQQYIAIVLWGPQPIRQYIAILLQYIDNIVLQ